MHSSIDLTLAKELKDFFDNTPSHFPTKEKTEYKSDLDNRRKKPGTICERIASTFELLGYYEEAIHWYKRGMEGAYAMAWWHLAVLLAKDTKHKNIEEAIRLHLQSWALWETEHDRLDIINTLKSFRAAHPSASAALVEIYYDYFKNGRKEFGLIKDLQKYQAQSRDLLIQEMDFLKKTAPALAENVDDQIKALVTERYLSYTSRSVKNTEEEKPTNVTLKSSPKPKKNHLPVPRKFTWTDQEITRSTGKPYVRNP